jgi:cytochrome c oxidase subunit IV
MREHVVGTTTNVVVCVILLVLALATTLIGRVDLGPWNLVIALAIAGVKALLILLYFMHLRWTAGLNRLVAVGGVLWLFILVAGVMDDYVTRAWWPIPGK